MNIYKLFSFDLESAFLSWFGRIEAKNISIHSFFLLTIGFQKTSE